jgi:hypothetical protein
VTTESTVTALWADQQRLADQLANEPGRHEETMAECRELAIGIARPDINRSAAENIPEGDGIRLGLLAIRDIGRRVADAIVAGAAAGDYTSFYDFVDRVDPVVINRRTLLALIRAGAFDTFGHPRQGLADVVAELVEDPAARPPIGADEWDLNTLINHEYHYLGMLVSRSPVGGVEELLKPYADITIGLVLTEDGPGSGTTVRVAGRLTDWTRRVTKLGRSWATATLMDATGRIEVLIYPNVYERAGGWIAESALVGFRARVDRSDERAPRLIAERVYGPADEVGDVLSGFGPDNYLYSLTHRVMQDAPGEVLAGFVPREPADTSSTAVFVAVTRAVRVHLAELMVKAARDFQEGRSCDDAHRELGVRDSWLPSAFFRSLARKMAGVVWPNYTSQQRDRMYELAAQVTEQHAVRWLAGRGKPAAVTAAELDALPSHIKWELHGRSFRITEYRRRGDMLAAYLHTHPSDEIVQDDIDELLLQVERGLPVERPFF